MGEQRRNIALVPTGRDLAIDATRGLAIWSMVSLHFADGTRLSAPTHSYPFVDGMSAFVLLSGLVLGIVYRRWTVRHSLRYAYGRLTRRLGSLYAAQLFISLAAIVAGCVVTAQEFRLIAVLPPDLSIGQQLWWSVTMRFLPSGGSILVLYLLLMASAYVLLPLLRRNQWVLILAASTGLYLVSQVATGGAMLIRSTPDGIPIQNWAAWQVLFVPALVIGWKWDDWLIPQRLDAALPWLLGVTAAGWLTLRYSQSLRTALFDSPALIDKLDLGPVRVVVAWLVVTTVYATFRRLLQLMRDDWFRPLVQTGSRSLDSYVIQAVALTAIPAWIVARPWDSRVGAVAALVVFGLCWAWAEFRSHFGIDKLHRLPSRMVTALRRTPAPAAEAEGEAAGIPAKTGG